MSEQGGNGARPAGDSGTSRRGFLAGAAGLTGVALSVGAWKPALAAVAPAAALNRGFTAGKIALQLDEAQAGFLTFADGGNAYADVVTEKLGSDFTARKHIAGVKYEDITINCGTGMSKGFYNWLGSTLNGKFDRHSGAIVGADVNFKIFTKTEFVNALISEVGMPALDAASKDSAKMTIKFAPEFTRRVTKTGGSLTNVASKVQQKWLVNNFKLSIDGVNTAYVNKIDAIVIKSNFSDFVSGDSRETQKVLSSLEIPNVKLSVAESHADDFFKWHEDFVIKGNNGASQEKKGSLSFLSPDLKTELFRLDFFGLGIFALDPDPLQMNTESIRRVTAQLYCESMSFTFKV
jgi:hypothetical protein